MTHKSIKQILMERDGMTKQQAQELIGDASEAILKHLAEGDEESAYNVCEIFFGLEPDYLDELFLKR